MEILLALVAELVIGAVIPVTIMIFQIIVLGVELLVWLIELLIVAFLGKAKGKPVPAKKETEVPADRVDNWMRKTLGLFILEFPEYRWFRRVVYWCGVASLILMTCSLAVIFVANLFFFEPIARWQLARVESKTGITVDFDSADGSLWTGRIQLNNASVRRADHPTSEFVVSASQIVGDVSVLHLLRATAIVEEVSVEGLRGTFQRVGAPKEIRLRKPFKTERLSVTDALLTVVDHTRDADPIEIPLEIESLVCEPFRSNYAVFDVMFRSNLSGSFAGSDMSIATERNDEHRQTRWDFSGLPIELAAPYVGGPLNWISHGKLDIRATDDWKGRAEDVEMQYEIVLHNVKATVPDDTSMLAKAVAVPTVALINKYPKRLPISFELQMTENDFEFTASPLASRLGRDIGESIHKQLVDKMEGKKDGVKAKLKSFFTFGQDDDQPPEEP